MVSQPSMIEIAGLQKVFLTHKGEELRAVAGLTLRVARGEIYGLLGPNGAGKTTTLRMLAGLMTPTAGRIAVDGRAAIDSDAGLFEPMALKERIGFLTANTGLYARLSPREVLDYFGALRGLQGDNLRVQTERWIALLEIGEFAARRCEGLSTGQRQRVQIARTLVGDPPVLVLDEPTHGLDVLSNQLILKFISEAGRLGRTIVLSTHHLDEVEDICQRFGLMHKGKMLAEGTLAELRALSGKERLSAVFRELVARDDRGEPISAAAVAPAGSAAPAPPAAGGGAA
ncbi:MAG: ABC transporter ATP-binding protein [Planctomycetes bacterium]|nr:ABC transporter ATP-binding protein [Planctomycetota bacterium]